MNFSLRDTALSYIKSLGEGRSIERAKKTRSRHKEELEATNTLNEYQKKVIPEGHRGNKNLGRKNSSSLLSPPQKSTHGRLTKC